MYWYEAVDAFPKYGRLAAIYKTARTLVDFTMGVKPGDRVTIVTDTEVSPLIYESIAGAVAESGGIATIAIMQPLAVPSAEPPAPIAAALLESDFLLGCASRSITHSHAAHEAWVERKIPYVVMSNMTEDMLVNGAALADYEKVREISLKLADDLNTGTTVRVTNPHGTDVTFDVEGRPFTPYYGKIEDRFTTTIFPGGEVNTCPLEHSGTGKIVHDRFIMEVGLLDEPVTWILEEGQVVDIQGGKQARQLEQIVETRGDEYSRYIGELAIGTNYMARSIGSALEDKEVYGEVHIAIGSGVSSAGVYRAAYQSTLHLDGVLSHPTVTVNDREVVRDGEILAAPRP
jgi:leucyl aminopeptidase (aminopeptidase T)